MKSLLKHSIVALLVAFACVPSQAQEKKIVIGILPTYDSSGQSYGGTVSQVLTGMLYQQFASNPKFHPVFLNPGGLYDPTSTAWVAEYVRTLDTPIDVVLSTIFAEPDDPKHGDLILHLKASELDPKTGDSLQASVSSTQIKDYKAMLDYGRAMIPTGSFDTSLVYQPSRNFDKQPVGKAAYALARQAADSVNLTAPKLTASGTAPPHAKTTSCKMTLKISYDYKDRHPSSKSYDCIINEREESLGIKEGVLEVEEPSAPLLMQIQVKDSPYKLPKQDVYLFDPVLDCGRASNILKVTIGPAGEAHTTWQ